MYGIDDRADTVDVMLIMIVIHPMSHIKWMILVKTLQSWLGPDRIESVLGVFPNFLLPWKQVQDMHFRYTA